MVLTVAGTPLPHAKRLNAYYLRDERDCVNDLIKAARLTPSNRESISLEAAKLVQQSREKAGTGNLFDALLQEYDLSNKEGVTLMRLAESLVRTPDFETSRLLIHDKLSHRDWAIHKGKSPSNFVNLTTQGLLLSSAWMKASGGAQAKNLISKLGDRALNQAVIQAMGIMGRHFVLGRDIEDAKQNSHRFEKDGFRFSYDMLGEAALTHEDAQKYRFHYLQAIQALAQDAQTHGSPHTAPGISVKLSALHPRYEFAKREDCVPALTTIVKEMALISKTNNIGLTIDAEEADRLEVSLIIAENLLRDKELADWDGLSIVVQAYQRRAVPVIEHLLSIARQEDRKFSIRLVKGAYWDSEIKRAQELGLSSYPVFTRKENTDLSYLACARLLLDNRDIVYPQFATHNANSLMAVFHMAGDVEGYLDPDLDPADIADDPVAACLSNTPKDNPLIPAPRDQFSGERLSASGIDFSQDFIEATLTDYLAGFKPITANSIIEGRDISGAQFSSLNPANQTESVGTWHSLPLDQLGKALKATKTSQWAQTSTTTRAAILNKAADKLEAQMPEFLTLCIKESGKTWNDAIAELREAIDFCRYYAAQILKPDYASRRSLGTVACISPWNFPLAIFMGQVVAALAAGNSVICKPAEQTPLIAYKAVKLLLDCGIPKDCLHLVLGPGSNLGAALIASPDINGVCFTGSTATAKRIMVSLADTGRAHIPVIAETGGLNAMIVDSTALLEQAVEDVIAAAFQSAGQRCSACRFVCVQDDIADDFITMLSGAMKTLTIDDPAITATDLGPVIDQTAMERLNTYRQEKEKLWVVAGESPASPNMKDGFFVRPLALEIPSIDALEDEQFGPILHLIRFKASELDNLVEQINKLGYGLTMGLHTRIQSRVDKIVAAAHVGNLYVNRNQIGAVVGVQPFGGHGLSGTGPKAGGPLYLKRLSQGKKPNFAAQRTSQTHLIAEAQTPFEGNVTAIFAAQKTWQNMDYLACLKAALPLTNLPANPQTELSDLISEAQLLFLEQELPGPTGERNTLSFHPRGVLLMLADNDILHNIIQLFKILTTKNGAVIIAAEGQENALKDIIEALNSHGLPQGLITFAKASEVEDLLQNTVNGVTASGQDRYKAANILARQKGAILPLLGLDDDLERYVLERTLTFDTTAAGGNASLLNMK